MADIKVPVDEPMFDDNPDENSPADGRAGKSVPAAAHTTIDKRAGNLELDSLDSRAHADVPKFVTVLPRVEIVIDARAAALAENSCFLCLGHDNGDYFFRSKRSRELLVIRDFEEQQSLGARAVGVLEGLERQGRPRVAGNR